MGSSSVPGYAIFISEIELFKSERKKRLENPYNQNQFRDSTYFGMMTLWFY